jgi:hypothetical protein
MQKICILALLGSYAAAAAEAPDPSPEESRHKIGLQIPIWLRARGKFTGFQLSGQGNVNRSYIDGYNSIDITGNAVSPEPPARYAFPRTSNFKFTSIAQVTNDSDPTDSEDLDPNGGTLALHGIAVTGGSFSKSRNADIIPGIELFYRYEIVERKTWSFGLEGGASYQRFEWDMSNPSMGNLQLITDIYPLGGVVLRPSQAGEEGFFEDVTGRKPVIGSVPQRSTTESVGVIVGQHELTLDALLLRLGPSLSWRPCEKWTFDLLAGLSAALTHTEYEYSNRAVTGAMVNGAPLVVDPQTGEVSDSTVKLGLYSAVRANYSFTKDWDAHVEVRHLWQDPIRLSGLLGSAEVDLSQGLAIAVGVRYRF